jgi:hypothetical protein
MAATQPNLGAAALKRLTVARILATISGAAYATDLGNVVKLKSTNKAETVEHLANDIAAKARVADMELVHTIGFGFTATLDEFSDQFLRLLAKASTSGQSTAVQSSGTGASASISSSLKGATYSLGKYDVTNVVVTVSAATKTLNTDYTLDAAAGTITILASGTITDASAVSVAFDHAAITFRTFTAGGQPTFIADFKITEYDQLGTSIRSETTFSGSAWVVDTSEDASTGFVTGDVIIKAWTKPVRKER